jgi:AcrR family transcriptional regulator
LTFRDRRRAERREGALRAARDLIVERSSLEFSMRELAPLAGVSARTLYNLFEHKDDILRTLTVEALDGIDVQLEGVSCSDAIEHSHALAMLPVRVFAETPGLYRPLIGRRLPGTRLGAANRVRWRQERVLEKAAQDGQLVPEVAPRALAMQLANQVNQASLAWGAGALDNEALCSTVEYGWFLVMAAAAREPHRASLLSRLGDCQAGVVRTAEDRDARALSQPAPARSS